MSILPRFSMYEGENQKYYIIDRAKLLGPIPLSDRQLALGVLYDLNKQSEKVNEMS